MKKITIPFLLHFCGKNLLLYLLYIGFGIIGIGRYEKCHIGNLSVSADKKIGYIGWLSVLADMEKSISFVHWFIT